MRDNRSFDSYGANILGVRQVVPRLLELFARRGIEATWATVGLLLAKTRSDILRWRPSLLPDYTNRRLCNYSWIPQVGDSEESDHFHYGASLIELIKRDPRQEIASHTFSHYYCLESGENRKAFTADLRAATLVAREWGISLKSIAFPRNQIKEDYLEICQGCDFTVFRGNLDVWTHRGTDVCGQTRMRRLTRLVDAYLPILGGKTYLEPSRHISGLVNVPSSRFLRPYIPSLRVLDPLRLWRIATEMTIAARRGHCYHLWWHPHNFGIHLEENLNFLSRVLDCFVRLRDRYRMRSSNMVNAAALGKGTSA